MIVFGFYNVYVVFLLKNKCLPLLFPPYEFLARPIRVFRGF